MEDTTRLCAQCDVVRPIQQFSGFKTCDGCRKSRREWFSAKRRSDPEWAEKARQQTRNYRSRMDGDPDYEQRKREQAERRLQQTREWRRRQGGFVRGDLVTATCAVCNDSFEYVFQGHRRKRCALCAKYDQEFYYYKLTGAQAAKLLEQQACEICGSVDPRRKDGRFRIDHCHETGKVRGVLCHPCNIALGLMQDKPERLRAAARYLEQHLGEQNAF